MDKAPALSSHLPDMLGEGWKSATFGLFRDGVEICHLRREDPAIALLKYAPGARVPYHLHTGLETILVLDGSQSDERGTYKTGDLVLNPEGTSHSVWSEHGCVILITWERPVKVLDEDNP
ncbi:MAG: cupin domain-containing protein [Pseudomonadota bacterium]